MAVVPRPPFNTFISGDCDDKAIVWKVIPDEEAQQQLTEEEQKAQSLLPQEPAPPKYKSVLVKELPGHTETVEFLKFNHDGKLLATGGMNNQIRIWNVDTMDLKCSLEDGPNEDLNFLEWHPKGNVLITGGKDYLVWMFNGANGQFMNCLQGHQGEVYSAQFSLND